MKQGDVCRMRLTIPSWPKLAYLLNSPYQSPAWLCAWYELIDKLCNQGLKLEFTARLDDFYYQRVDDLVLAPLPDLFALTQNNVHYGYDTRLRYNTLFPEEMVGKMPDGTRLECDFFPEAQRACVAWIICAQRRRVHRDMIKIIGKLLLATWNDAEVWYDVYKKK